MSRLHGKRVIREGNVTWEFADNCLCAKYDTSTYYTRQYQSCAGGVKAVDIVAFDGDSKTTWMIEAKDYRGDRRRDANKGHLADEVARKAHDTLAGLVATAANGQGDEQLFAERVIRAARFRVVLHLEQATQPSKLFPLAVDPADVLAKLRQLVRPIDFHPIVMWSGQQRVVPWTARWSPGATYE